MTIVLSLSNCTDICPLQTLMNATIDLIPRDSRSLCGWSTKNLTETEDLSGEKEFNSSNYNGSVSNRNRNLIFILILLFSVVVNI